MSLFSPRKSIKSRSIILDIQSGLVRGVIAELKHNEPALITAVSVKSIPLVPLTNEGSRMVQDILRAIEEVLKQLTSIHAHEKIDTIHYVLSSPWIFSESKSIKISFEKDTRISQSMIDTILKDQMIKNTPTSDTQHVELKVSEIKLNGYITEEFLGKSTKNLEVSFYNSYGSKAFFDKLSITVHKVTHIKKHEYHSALLLQYSALRLINDTQQDYIYIHAHSELTDVVVVKAGLCKHTSSFPFGTITLLRRMADSTDHNIEATDSLLTLYEQEKLSEAEKNNTKKIIDPLMLEWSNSCLKYLSDTFGIIYIPRIVFLSTHSHYELFKNSLTFNSDLNLDIISYDSVAIDSHVTFESGVAESTLMKLYTLVIANMI